MVDPDTALAYASAGVTLNDSPAQINYKLAQYAYAKEVSLNSDTMAKAGYSYLLPGQSAPVGTQVVTTIDSQGVQRQWYTTLSGAQIKATGGGGGGTTTPTTNTTPDNIKFTPAENKQILALGVEGFTKEFQNFLINALTPTDARKFVEAWKAEQNKKGMSIDPIAYYETWRNEQNAGSSDEPIF
jgi:hypothetical protein